MNKFILILLSINFSVYIQAQKTKLPPITPRWAFEHIVWEDSANNQSASEKLVDLYLQHNMPVSAIIIDSPWSLAYNDFEWNTARYPNAKEMIQNLYKKNVKTILWLTGCINNSGLDVPIQKHHAFDEVIQKKYVVNNGKTSKWWKGEGLHLDFTNPRAVAWWNTQLDKALTDGVYGYKVDQGEIYFGDTVHTSIGHITNTAFRPYYYNSMFQYITQKRNGGIIVGRPFSHQGGFEASVEQLSMGWCGDFEGSWKGLKKQIQTIYKSAESGYGAPGCEVGGFFKARSTKNELIRYAQFGAFTACMINGGENGAFTNHLPWYHGQEAEACYREVVWLHSQLIPYMFSTIVKCSKTGGSLLKNINYKDESHTLGESIFTKAITSEDSTVTFTLPNNGRWVDFRTNTEHAGGETISRTYAINQYPFFIKTGAIIPMNITNNYSGIGDYAFSEKQTILIVPGEDKSIYEYHRPLGDGIDYETIKISYRHNNICVEGENNLPYVFIIRNVAKPSTISNADWAYNENQRELRINKTGKSFKIKISQ